MNSQYLQFMQTPAMMEALVNSSVSYEDANLRSREYAKMFSRNDELMDIWGKGNQPNLLQKQFSGYAETPLLSTQYFNASVASYVSSFAGYMSIERDFDQPNGLFYWFDVLGVTDMRSVIPNLGADNYQDIQSMGGFTAEGTLKAAKTDGITNILGRKIIPGTVRIKLTDATTGKSYELIDNGQGSLMAVAGVISNSKINYLSGTIFFQTLSLEDENSKYVINGKEDVTGTPCNTTGASDEHANDKRFIAKMQQLGLSTVPDMLVAEYNIAALGALKKATGSDMATFLFTKLRELYTKMINYKLVKTLQDGYDESNGNVETSLDLSNASSATALAGRFYDYRSRVDLFDAYLINVESALAFKAVKGVNVTAYVAGNQACNQFQKGGMIGKFEKNTKMTYINDLLGWYDGIPVLRSTDIKEAKDSDGKQKAVFYAIHKTADGQMAPLARGIYMPLTDTPTIGNYNNPTQMAAGIYYQEGTKYMAKELVHKVEFTVGL